MGEINLNPSLSKHLLITVGNQEVQILSLCLKHKYGYSVPFGVKHSVASTIIAVQVGERNVLFHSTARMTPQGSATETGLPQ